MHKVDNKNYTTYHKINIQTYIGIWYILYVYVLEKLEFVTDKVYLQILFIYLYLFKVKIYVI